MSETLETFVKFMEHETAHEMYITGKAGTGKTTSLGELAEYCLDNQIEHNISAYTHNAVKVLASKMPEKACLSTLHSYLTKRPTINTYATKVKHVDSNTLTGESREIGVLFVDEFSMVGGDDYKDIRAAQYDIEGNLKMKVLYIGDMNQLPPVGDTQDIEPCGDFVVWLTKVYRQEGDNQLLDTLLDLDSYISGATPKPLVEHDTLLLKRDIIKEYNDRRNTAVILAYTNKRVQGLNAEIEGKQRPDIGDAVFSPTIRKTGHLVRINEKPKCIMPIMGELITTETKFNPLKTLRILEGVDFFDVEEETEKSKTVIPRACVFGHKNYRNMQLSLKTKATNIQLLVSKQLNSDMVEQLGVKQATRQWLFNNPTHELTKARAKAWREFLTFDKCVICLDFVHAMTVHKSQGSTYDTVILDIKDVGICANKNYNMYLRLLYVAVSRASNLVITN